MKTFAKTCLVIIVLLNLSSCMIQEPISVAEPENNNTYKIEYLFEHEGCKMYRFMDDGTYIYFSDCNNDVTHVLNDSVQMRVIDKSKKQLSK